MKLKLEKNNNHLFSASFADILICRFPSMQSTISLCPIICIRALVRNELNVRIFLQMLLHNAITLTSYVDV